MNSQTFTDFETDMNNHKMKEINPNPDTRPREPHLVVQILSVIAFGIFSIVAIALAFAAFWVAGLILAVIIAATWAGNRTFGGRRRWHRQTAAPTFDNLAPAVRTGRTSGNTSFDAYRADVLARLEQENADFDAFLARLRDARDASEFDQFLEDRAAKSITPEQDH